MEKAPTSSSNPTRKRKLVLIKAPREYDCESQDSAHSSSSQEGNGNPVNGFASVESGAVYVDKSPPTLTSPPHQETSQPEPPPPPADSPPVAGNNIMMEVDDELQLREPHQIGQGQVILELEENVHAEARTGCYLNHKNQRQR